MNSKNIIITALIVVNLLVFGGLVAQSVKTNEERVTYDRANAAEYAKQYVLDGFQKVRVEYHDKTGKYEITATKKTESEE